MSIAITTAREIRDARLLEAHRRFLDRCKARGLPRDARAPTDAQFEIDKQEIWDDYEASIGDE